MAGVISRDVRVRRADPVADRDAILGVLARNLPLAAGVDRHEWLYLSNPCGQSRVWLAEDTKTGEAVGTSAGHPKKVKVDGQVLTALNLSDFAVDKAYRSLGPALKLLRATLEPMQKGEFAFSYDHPSESMLAIYKRMGAKDVSKRNRWVRLLKVSPSLKKKWGAGLKSRIVGRAGDLALRVKDVVTKKRSGIQVELLRGDPPEIDVKLDARVSLARSADYLRWRFQKATTHKYETLIARKNGEIAGYLAFRSEKNDVVALMDLAARGPDVIATLLSELVSHARARGASAIWATLLAGTPSEAILAANGYLLRDTHPGVCIYAPKGPPEMLSALEDPRSWWTFEGDQDV
jgi:hypothetical protein